MITEKQLAERYTRLFAASLAETDDVGEALAAADLAMEISLSAEFESEHPRNDDGEFIGKGSTGEIRKVGSEVHKASTRDEAKIYKKLSGVKGIASSREENGKIITPHFKNIISVDDVPRERRKSMAPIVIKAYSSIVNAITALSKEGYDYNDPLQIGFDEKRNASLFDFSAANKVSESEATDANLGRFSAFLQEFGAEKLADGVRRTNSIRRSMEDIDNPFMEDEPETKDAKKLLNQLDGKKPHNLYFTTNARTIPRVPQTEHRDGYKIIASDRALSDEFMKEWEITPVIHEKHVDVEASFAFDIFNRRAQGILNRAMAAAKQISQTAKRSLLDALKRSPAEMAQAVVKFIETYRRQLTELLTTTQLASVLDGAREVASKVPRVPPPSLGGSLPSSISPDAANAILERISRLSTMEQWEEIYKLPPDQQAFVVSNLRISGAMPPPPVFTPPRPPADSPESIQFPIIDEAVRDLSSRNVISKPLYLELDAAARQKAFTVAAVDSQETLTRIRDALAENVKEGADFETFKRRVLDDVSEGTFLSDGHMENVFRTNVQTAFSDGQMSVLSHPFVRSGFPYVAYEAIHDDRVEDTHLALESYGIGGTNIYRSNDPVFLTFRPPWRWLCRCSWIPMTIQMAADAGIEEAKLWKETGIEPTPPAFVQMPPFRPPPEFQRSLAAQPVAVRLSMESLGIKFSSVEDVGLDEELLKEVESIVPFAAPATLPCVIGKIDKWDVVFVDGDEVMLQYDMDFNQGNNSEESPEFINEKTGSGSKDQIWIDATEYQTEWVPVLYHETHECRDMDKGMSYDEAHDRANVGEKIIRERMRDKELLKSKSEDGNFTIIHRQGYDEIVEC